MEGDERADCTREGERERMKDRNADDNLRAEVGCVCVCAVLVRGWVDRSMLSVVAL